MVASPHMWTLWYSRLKRNFLETKKLKYYRTKVKYHLNTTQNTELLWITSSFCFFFFVTEFLYKVGNYSPRKHVRCFAIGKRAIFTHIKSTAILFIDKCLKWIQVKMVSYLEWLKNKTELDNFITFIEMCRKKI